MQLTWGQALVLVYAGPPGSWLVVPRDFRTALHAFDRLQAATVEGWTPHYDDWRMSDVFASLVRDGMLEHRRPRRHVFRRWILLIDVIDLPEVAIVRRMLLSSERDQPTDRFVALLDEAAALSRAIGDAKDRRLGVGDMADEALVRARARLRRDLDSSGGDF